MFERRRIILALQLGTSANGIAQVSHIDVGISITCSTAVRVGVFGSYLHTVPASPY